MIKRAEEDRRSSSKGRKNLGRRKYEKYSYYTYKVTIAIMFLIAFTHITLVLLNIGE